MKTPPSLILLRTVAEERDVRSWNFSANFEIGRGEQCGLMIRDGSVSRRHAEVFWDEGWHLRDLGSRNGTFVNGVRLETGVQPLCSGDEIEIGVIKLRIEIQAPADVPPSNGPMTARGENVIETVAHASMERVLKELAGNEQHHTRTEEKIFALFSAATHLGNHQSEEELINNVLEEALQVLDAQRGALVLLNGEGDLDLRATRTSTGCRQGAFSFSRHMARRCLQEGTSILCSRSQFDWELKEAASVLAGEMNSILCVLLRTPRKRLGVLHLDRHPTKPSFTYEDLQLADALAASVSAGLESAQLSRQQQEWFLGTLATLVQAVELRDPYTAGHAQRVTHFSLMLGRQLNLTPVDLHWIKIGTPLHDIGKIGISDAILNKPGPLTDEEFQVMQSHVVKGEEMLRSLINLQPILPIVRSHHERWDGRGYPDGLIGEDTPLLARVVAVADTFDAMTTDRPYRQGMSFVRAADEIRRGCGTQFDPVCAEAFFDIRVLLEEEATLQTPTSGLGRSAVSPLKDTKRFRMPVTHPVLTLP